MKKLKVLFILHFSLLIFLTACGGGGGGGGSGDNSSSAPVQEKTNDQNNQSNQNDQDNNQTQEQTDNQDEDNTTKISSSLYGKWRYIDTGEEILILSNSTLDYETKNENLLLVKDKNSGSRRYLIRAGVSNAKIKGQLLVETQKGTKSLRSYAKAGSIEVILKNIADSNLKSKTSTNNDGQFEDSSQPSGTTVEITATKDNKTFKTEIDVNDPEIDIGTFILKDENEYNFKSTIVSNEEFLYADGKDKNLTLRIKNIGNIEGTDTYYQIFYEGKEIARGITGTVFSQESKDINFSFTPESITDNEKTLEFTIKMGDSNKRTWEDKAYLKIYRQKFDLNIRSAGAKIKGYIVLPNKNVKNISINQTGKITLPVVDTPYILVLTNPDKSSNQNVYTIGVGEEAPLIDPNFIDTSAYEPNDDESSAKTLAYNKNAQNNQAISFLGYGDIDYWKISYADKTTIYENTLDVFKLYTTSFLQLSGEDSDLFTIDSKGVVIFISSPDYENPTDSDKDNVYKFNIIKNNTSTPIEITIKNAPTIFDTNLSICSLYDLRQAGTNIGKCRLRDAKSLKSITIPISFNSSAPTVTIIFQLCP